MQPLLRAGKTRRIASRTRCDLEENLFLHRPTQVMPPKRVIVNSETEDDSDIELIAAPTFRPPTSAVAGSSRGSSHASSSKSKHAAAYTLAPMPEAQLAFADEDADAAFARQLQAQFDAEETEKPTAASQSRKDVSAPAKSDTKSKAVQPEKAKDPLDVLDQLVPSSRLS
jgi:hypothetical protein